MNKMADLSTSDLEARSHTNAARAAVKGPEEMIEFYKSWSAIYDEDFNAVHYKGPRIVATIAQEFFPTQSRSSKKVLDVAAGTGTVGVWLNSFGFDCIDALDPSTEMLEKLREKNVYRSIYKTYIGHGETDIEADSYDLVIMSGGFVEGHIPLEGLEEMLRVAKPGGYVMFAIRIEFIKTVEEYKNLEEYTAKLEAKNLWKKIERRTEPNYFFDRDSYVFVFQKV